MCSLDNRLVVFSIIFSGWNNLILLIKINLRYENIKAIIFDAYGTLFDVNSAAEKCKDKIGSKWEGFANYWRTTQLEYTWLRSLMNKHKDFWQVTEDSLDKSMKAFNIDISMRMNC